MHAAIFYGGDVVEIGGFKGVDLLKSTGGCLKLIRSLLRYFIVVSKRTSNRTWLNVEATSISSLDAAVARLDTVPHRIADFSDFDKGNGMEFLAFAVNLRIRKAGWGRKCIEAFTDCLYNVVVDAANDEAFLLNVGCAIYGPHLCRPHCCRNPRHCMDKFNGVYDARTP